MFVLIPATESETFWEEKHSWILSTFIALNLEKTAEVGTALTICHAATVPLHRAIKTVSPVNKIHAFLHSVA